jgi:uncharacterized protein (TIGR03546 family)
MYLVFKLLRGFVRALISAAEPWQIALAAALGTLLGFMPLWLGGPNQLALTVLLLAIVLNCHLGTVFVFWGVMKLLALAVGPLALVLGNALDGLAQAASGIGLLHGSGWSHTGWLGLALVGLALAPVAAFAMARVTVLFRVKLRDRLLENKRLALAGKVGGNPVLVRFALWFFDL